MKSSNFRYLVGVDHLRGIAALTVLLFHGTQLITGDLKGRSFDPTFDRGLTQWNPVKALVAEGQLGVSLFMVLSGFIFVSGLIGRQWSVPLFFYNRLVRMSQQGVPLRMTVDLQVQYQNDDPMAYNTVAEIPGSDRKDEIVMLGGHLDSWHSGTGATDNGAGVAVATVAGFSGFAGFADFRFSPPFCCASMCRR